MSDSREITTTANPFGNGEARLSGALISVEQQRAIAEVQARMIIARASPRDPMRCMELIINDCKRPTLAADAFYQYARGGNLIEGPSIRLMEALARRWGNIAAGIKEISRQGGASECVAYAWDLESGYYDERQFQVRHWRDTRSGGYQIKDERDIYELVANMGQRRKRAVLQSVIPADVTEAAEDQCNKTLRASIDMTPEGVAKIVASFERVGVRELQIEKHIQCKLAAIRPGHVIRLRKIYASIKDGMAAPEDWFEAEPEQVASRARGTAALREKMASAKAEPQKDEPGLVIFNEDGVEEEIEQAADAIERIMVALSDALHHRGIQALHATYENNESFLIELTNRGLSAQVRNIEAHYRTLVDEARERASAGDPSRAGGEGPILAGRTPPPADDPGGARGGSDESRAADAADPMGDADRVMAEDNAEQNGLDIVTELGRKLTDAAQKGKRAFDQVWLYKLTATELDIARPMRAQYLEIAAKADAEARG